MKKIYLLLISILFVLASCDDEVIKNPAQKHDLSEYCGYEVRSKMVDGSKKNTHYYFCLHNEDTTLFNISVGKKVYYEYEIGDTIKCEKKVNVNDVSMSDVKESDGGYKIITIGGENYLVIKLENNISINDTTLVK